MLRVAFVLRSTEVHPVFSGLFPPIFRVSRSASFRGILKLVVRPRPSPEDCFGFSGSDFQGIVFSGPTSLTDIQVRWWSPACVSQSAHSLPGGSPSLHLALGNLSNAKRLLGSLKAATGLFPSMVPFAAWWKSFPPPCSWRPVPCKVAAWKSEGRLRFVFVNGFSCCLVEVRRYTLPLATRPLQSGCLEVSRPPPVCFRQLLQLVLGGSPSLHLALGDPSLAKWLPGSLKAATGLFPSIASVGAWWKSVATLGPWRPVPCKVAAWKSQGRHRFVSVNCFSWCLVEDRRYTLPLALCLGPPPASG